MAEALTKNCAICGKPVNLKTQPFCSARCANLDLGRWLGEGYRIETHEEPEGIIRITLPSSPDADLDD